MGSAFVPHPVDPTYVASPTPGWYSADFHMHGFHSNPNGPTGPALAEEARARGLQVVPVTEYVTSQHWGELGPVQEANPDLLIWPSREIITYFGHAMSLGETPDVLEIPPRLRGGAASGHPEGQPGRRRLVPGEPPHHLPRPGILELLPGL